MKYKKIVGYGAPAKATTALNFFSIKNDTISFIIDDNPLKVNKFVPGTGIKIRSINTIKKKQKLLSPSSSQFFYLRPWSYKIPNRKSPELLFSPLI